MCATNAIPRVSLRGLPSVLASVCGDRHDAADAAGADATAAAQDCGDATSEAVTGASIGASAVPPIAEAFRGPAIRRKGTPGIAAREQQCELHTGRHAAHAIQLCGRRSAKRKARLLERDDRATDRLTARIVLADRWCLRFKGRVQMSARGLAKSSQGIHRHRRPWWSSPRSPRRGRTERVKI